MLWQFNISQFFYTISITILSTQECIAIKSAIIHVPEIVKSGEAATLSCEYELENESLYSIRWYWNDEEFYRYIPKESPPYKSFPIKLVNVDMSKSGANTVTIYKIHQNMTGNYKCEISADQPFFHTNILVAHMIVIENGNRGIQWTSENISRLNLLSLVFLSLAYNLLVIRI